MPTIRECHDTGCYFVQFDGGEEHAVDLLDEEYPGNGSCMCHDFTCRCSPNFKENGGKHVPYWLRLPGSPVRAVPNPERSVCKHLEATWVHVRTQLSLAMLKEREDNARK